MFNSIDVLEALGIDRDIDGALEFTAAAVDSREIGPKEAFFALRGERFDGNDFIDEVIEKGVKLVVAEVPDDRVITVEDSLGALQRLAAFVRMKKAYSIVAVTGSVGKTLTKDMIAHVLKGFSLTKSKKSFNNDYGVPLSLLSAGTDDTHLVVEVGANHLGEIDKLCKIIRPNIGVITNVGSAHIGEFGSPENTLKAKTEMIDNILENGTIIFFGDDIRLKERILKKADGIKTVSVGFNRDNDVYLKDIFPLDGGVSATVVLFGKSYPFRLKLIGKHYLIALAFAVAAANEYGVDIDRAIASMDTFETPEGRFNIVNLRPGLTVIDDTYNASPEAMINAIQSLDYLNGDVVAVLGEMRELGEYSRHYHEKVGGVIGDRVNYLIPYGENARIIAEAAIASGYNPKKVFYADTIKDVNKIIQENDMIKDSTVILLKGGRFVHMERACLEIEGKAVACVKQECSKYIHCSKCGECF